MESTKELVEDIIQAGVKDKLLLLAWKAIDDIRIADLARLTGKDQQEVSRLLGVGQVELWQYQAKEDKI